MRRVALVLFATALVPAVLSGQSKDWSQWRGPGRDGIVSVFKPPATWPDQPKPLWKVNAGVGHASPVVAGNRVFLFSRVGEQEAMTAYETASGREIWRQTYDAPYQMSPAARSHGKGPKSTPLVEGGRVYAFGISGILSAFDAASGKVLWRRDFAKEFPATSPEFGTAMSPILDGRLLIAHVGGGRGGALMALDSASGVTKWSWTGEGPAYASPVIGIFGGVRHLVTQSQSHLVALSPADGTELWRIPFTTDYEQNIVTPVIAGDLLIYGGLSKPTTAVRLKKNSGGWTPEKVWENPDIPMYMSSPVASGGVLYGHTHRNRGQFFAVDLRTGKSLWTSPPRQGENASVVIASGVLIATTTDGKMVVMNAGPTFQPVREYTVADSPVWAHPAFTARGLLIKDLETLAYWTF